MTYSPQFCFDAPPRVSSCPVDHTVNCPACWGFGQYRHASEPARIFALRPDDARRARESDTRAGITALLACPTCGCDFNGRPKGNA